MRQIEKRMTHALLVKKDWKQGNTKVTWDIEQEIASVHLHGQLIAWINKRDKELSLTLAGFPTKTTRSRLNALLQSYSKQGKFYQRAGMQYFDKGLPVLPKMWLQIAL